jgi:serine/threonine protein kinase
MSNYKSEVENLMQLDHPNIIRLEKVVEGRKKYAMVMEYVGHSSLYEVIERQGSKKLSEPCKS